MAVKKRHASHEGHEHAASHANHSEHSNRHDEVMEKLIDNFVSMQKVLTNLSLKFDELSDQISKLLELFEISAKAVAERKATETEPNRDITTKLNVVLDQNKTIAKGVSLIGERLTGIESHEPQKEEQFPPIKRPRPLPRF